MRAVIFSPPLLVAFGALVVAGFGCNQSESVLAPGPSVLHAANGSNACIQTCAQIAMERMAVEKKRFRETLALYPEDNQTILVELELHKEIQAEIRRELIECRRGCRSNKKL